MEPVSPECDLYKAPFTRPPPPHPPKKKEKKKKIRTALRNFRRSGPQTISGRHSKFSTCKLNGPKIYTEPVPEILGVPRLPIVKARVNEAPCRNSGAVND